MDEIENQLMNLEVQKVSLVHSPAIRRTIAVRKSADEAEVETGGNENMADVAEKIEQAEQPAEVVKDDEIAVLKGTVEALSKALRIKELEPLCKDLNLDAEQVFKSEQISKELTDYFVGKIDVLTKQVTALMKELGTAGEPEPVDDLMSAATKIAKDRNIPLADALIAVGNEQPELARKHVAGR